MNDIKYLKSTTQKEFKNSFEYNTWHGERPTKDKDDSKKDQSKD